MTKNVSHVPLPRPRHSDLLRRLDSIRLALGSEYLAVARRLPRGSEPPRFEVLAQVGPDGDVQPPETRVPLDLLLELMRDGRPLEVRTQEHSAAWSVALHQQSVGWVAGWPMPSDRWPTVFFVAWRAQPRTSSSARAEVARAGMEALARALAPPAWLPFAPLRPPARAPEEWSDLDEGSLATTLAKIERDLIVRALNAAEGNKTVAAQRLCLSRQGLYRKLYRHGLLVRPGPALDSGPVAD